MGNIQTLDSEGRLSWAADLAELDSLKRRMILACCDRFEFVIAMNGKMWMQYVVDLEDVSSNGGVTRESSSSKTSSVRAL